MTRVVSLSVFGESNHYCKDTAFFRKHLGAVIRGYRALFPGWEIRIHHDDSLYHGNYGATLFGLARRGIVRLVRVGNGEQLCKAMLWRLLPIWEPGVEYVLSRDVDSCPSYQERVAVDRFIRSGAAVHSISAVATHNTPLNGGLCGFLAPAFRELTGFRSWAEMVDFEPRGLGWGTHGADEQMLRLNVWPKVRAATCEHRLGGAPQFPGVLESHATIEGEVDLSPELKRSIEFAPYMGSSSFDLRAAAFFDAVAPTPAIAEAESFAGESSIGDVERLPWAVISSDRSELYSFFAPLTVRMWRRLGFRAKLFLVGTADEWNREPRFRLVVERSREAGASIVFVPRLEDFANGTVAQVARLFASGFAFDDDEFVYQADIDAWPLSRSFYCDRDFDRLLLLAANANGRQFSIQVGARARTWRAMMGIARGEGYAALQETLARGVGRGATLEGAWHFDEELLARQVVASPFLASAVQVVRQGDPPRDRIDRAAWRNVTTLDGFVDAHLLRPGWEHWPRLRAVLALALPAELDWFDSYFAEWSRS